MSVNLEAVRIEVDMNVVCRVIGTMVLLALAAVFATGQTPNPGRYAAGSDVLSCFPAPCALPPMQVSDNGAWDATVVTDPSNPRNLIVGSFASSSCEQGGVDAYLTSNAGSEWVQHCMPDWHWLKTEYYPAAGLANGPIIAYDRDGVAYLGGTYIGGGDSMFEGFQKTMDGTHWTAPRPIVPPNFEPQYCWIAADTNDASSYVNSIYVSCAMQSRYFQHLMVARSRDGGMSWQYATPGAAQTNMYQNTTLAVGRDGSVYLTWVDCPTENVCVNGPVNIMFSRSDDGGKTWSAPVLVAPAALIYPLPNTNIDGPQDTPAIGVDNSDGLSAGSLYVAMYDWTGEFMQVQVVRSTDDGTTWSEPVPVAPGFTHDQFFPWISVSPAGLVGVSWLDRRNDPANYYYQAFAAISVDGGQTFQPNIQLTKEFSNPQIGGQLEMGSYTGDAWDGPDYFIAAWMDGSQGEEMQDVIGGIRLK